MEKITLNAYLLFDNNCREAMRDSIMHSSLMGGDVAFFACDNPNPQAGGMDNGRISLAIGGHEEERLRQVFEALSTGGKIIFPLEKQGWGDIFGVVSDQFGINWMVNISSKAPNEKPGL